jgi:hypothetical protein
MTGRPVAIAAVRRGAVVLPSIDGVAAVADGPPCAMLVIVTTRVITTRARTTMRETITNLIERTAVSSAALRHRRRRYRVRVRFA